jgi:hypothetical protein
MSAGTAWLNHALCTDPADRPAAEEAITELYSQVDKPPPTFVWVDSPVAALPFLRPPESLTGLPHRGPLPVENALATHYSNQRRLGPLMRDPLRLTVREAIGGLIRAQISQQLGVHWRGQHDADWVARLRESSPWVTLAKSCGWWWPRDRLCVVAERPTAQRTEPVDNGLRLHSADGPAIEYPDGWTVHAWHGVRVPSWVIDSPTVDRIAAESNVEVRRCAIERIGWQTFIEGAGLRAVSKAPDPGNPGHELRLYDLPYERWGAPTRLLLAINGSVERDGTRRQYGLRVPPWFDDPLDAAGWTYGLTGTQYAQLQRRT